MLPDNQTHGLGEAAASIEHDPTAQKSAVSSSHEAARQGGTPSSNYGVKVPYEVLNAADLTPPANSDRGHGGRLGRVLDMSVPEPETGARLVASVDWISCTLPQNPGWRALLDEVVMGICDVREPWQEMERGFLGYEKSARYGPVVVAWGGSSQRDTVYLSIPGTVCGALSAHKLAQMAVLLEGFGARLTRLDCAVDDYDGKYLTIDRMRQWYVDGKFVSNGRPPKATFISDEGSGGGCTFYVGTRAGGKFLRVYEKGKQLGDKDSPWVRVEIQLGNKLRILPWEALSRPADVMAGAYPALRAVSRAPLAVSMYYVKSRKKLRKPGCLWMPTLSSLWRCSALMFHSAAPLKALMLSGTSSRVRYCVGTLDGGLRYLVVSLLSFGSSNPDTRSIQIQSKLEQELPCH